MKPYTPANAVKYPKYFKITPQVTHMDVYQVHAMFPVDDPSGAIRHASKKLLLAGVRTGNKPFIKDIQEARDTLNRWLEMYDADEGEDKPF